MRIAIVGPGAIGSLFAAYLSKSKNEIWLLDKDNKRAKKLNDNGIKITGVSGNWQAKVNTTANPKDIQTAELVIICVKAYNTKAAINHAKSLCDKDTMILTLQNGVGNTEIIAEAVGAEKVICGVTNLGATSLDSGVVRHAGIGETVIGRMDSKTPVLLRSIRETFNKVGLATKISRDIKGILWSKLIINVGINALTAITHLNNGRLIEFEGTKNILQTAVKEAIKVARRKRIKLIYDDPLAKVETVCEATATNISSMLQDILKQKRTEIDFINGMIVRQGQSLSIATPVNTVLTHIVKTIEASYKLQLK